MQGLLTGTGDVHHADVIDSHVAVVTGTNNGLKDNPVGPVGGGNFKRLSDPVIDGVPQHVTAAGVLVPTEVLIDKELSHPVRVESVSKDIHGHLQTPGCPVGGNLRTDHGHSLSEGQEYRAGIQVQIMTCEGKYV